MRRVTGIVREGRGGQVKAYLPEDGIMSPWLDVLATETKGGAAYGRYRPGTQVRILLDEHGETGDVLGALFSAEDPAPEDSHEVFVRRFGDGTVIRYDERSGTMTLQTAGGTSFELEGNTLRWTGDVEIAGNLTVEGDTELQHTTIKGIGQVGD